MILRDIPILSGNAHFAELELIHLFQARLEEFLRSYGAFEFRVQKATPENQELENLLIPSKGCKDDLTFGSRQELLFLELGKMSVESPIESCDRALQGAIVFETDQHHTGNFILAKGVIHHRHLLIIADCRGNWQLSRIGRDFS
jgi:hypothetical protein